MYERKLPMFSQKNTLLIIVDMQERLLGKIENAAQLTGNALILIESCKILNLPVIFTEQYPEGIGPTSPGLLPSLGNCPKISKRTFSCCRERLFMDAIEKIARKQILIAGIETHICVMQTALDLMQKGYKVQIAADAVGSRAPANRETGLNRIRAAGAEITSVESAVFELLETSECPEFKRILPFIK